MNFDLTGKIASVLYTERNLAFYDFNICARLSVF